MPDIPLRGVVLCGSIMAVNGWSMQQNSPTQARMLTTPAPESVVLRHESEGSCTPQSSQISERATFKEWINGRRILSLGTNAGAETLPFQDWCKIKEAFAPELVERAIGESLIPVHRCIDPFGGSGTTGLACQFLGVHPTVVEVNPYLSDLIEAKITGYPPTETLIRDLNFVVEAIEHADPDRARQRFALAPSTLLEPGKNDRWIFNTEVAVRIAALLDAIENLGEPTRRLFRILLGGILVEVSNIRVTGKGRRYRRNWKKRVNPPGRVVELFLASASRAIKHIKRFSSPFRHFLRNPPR